MSQNLASFGISRSYNVPNENIGDNIFGANTRADAVSMQAISNSSPSISVMSKRMRSVSMQHSTTAGASNPTASNTRTTSILHPIESNTEDVDRLRSEIVNIRQEMERLREDRSFVHFRDGPPPSYASEIP